MSGWIEADPRRSLNGGPVVARFYRAAGPPGGRAWELLGEPVPVEAGTPRVESVTADEACLVSAEICHGGVAMFKFGPYTLAAGERYVVFFVQSIDDPA